MTRWHLRLRTGVSYWRPKVHRQPRKRRWKSFAGHTGDQFGFLGNPTFGHRDDLQRGRPRISQIVHTIREENQERPSAEDNDGNK